MRQQADTTSSSITLLPLLCLLSCLLFAQGLGFMHRITHAQGASPEAVTASGFAVQAGGNVLHDSSTSCSAFDAACLAHSLNAPPVSLPLLPSAAVLSLWIAFLCWKQPFQRLFSSRAPPA